MYIYIFLILLWQIIFCSSVDSDKDHDRGIFLRDYTEENFKDVLSCLNNSEEYKKSGIHVPNLFKIKIQQSSTMLKIVADVLSYGLEKKENFELYKVSEIDPLSIKSSDVKKRFFENNFKKKIFFVDAGLLVQPNYGSLIKEIINSLKEHEKAFIVIVGDDDHWKKVEHNSIWIERNIDFEVNNIYEKSIELKCSKKSKLGLLKYFLSFVGYKGNLNDVKLERELKKLSADEIGLIVNNAAITSMQYNGIIDNDLLIRAFKDNALKLNKKNDARFVPQQTKTKFEDVAGLEYIKSDLFEIIDFLKNPKKYKDMGAKVPKGILMSGDPGNGKTLLARAVAGEAEVPFFYASAAEFDESLVGVGAARVRELFKTARMYAPSIIFIDELDAIGKRSDEGSSLVNQLLTEMDGFVQNKYKEPVIVLAATNLEKNIDSALNRPGRFDVHVHIDYPTLKERIEILKVHARDKKISDDVDLEIVGRMTAGFSGAKLKNLLNSAALLAIRLNKDAISMDEISKEKDRILMGKENKYLNQDDDNVKKTAYHEIGHSLLSLHIFQKYYPYEFNKVSILPHGGVLGITSNLPIDDQVEFSKEQMTARIVALMGGRAAEELIFGHIGTGASDDLKEATIIARQMVTKYGMGKSFGLASCENYKNISSELTIREIDLEVKDILNSAYKKAYSLLSNNRNLLDRLTLLLIEKKTLDSKTIIDIVNSDKISWNYFFSE